MIKFAIIGTELKNVFQVSNRLQNESTRLSSRLHLLAKRIAESDESIRSARTALNDASGLRRASLKSDDEIRRKDRRLEELETFVIRAAQVSNISQEKHEEHVKKLSVLEKELAKAEEKSRAAEERLRAIEEEVFRITNNLNCIEVFGIGAFQEEEGGGEVDRVGKVKADEERVDELLDKLEKEEAKADKAEKEASSLRMTVERMDFFLKHACDQYTRL